MNEDKEKENITIKLVKIIGSPFIHKGDSEILTENNILELYYHAKKNRITLFFLDVLEKYNKLYKLSTHARYDKIRYHKIFNTMAQLTDFLKSINIEHAIFKSIKPFPDASVDIDTIIFSSEKYDIMLKEFLKTNWQLLEYGPQSTTFFDTEAEVGIDLYREIAVSWVVYLDKEKLRNYVSLENLPTKKKVYTLESEADLISTIAHSIIKEQIFTLAEFYAFLIWLKTMNSSQIENFKKLIYLNNILLPVKCFVTLSMLLHKEAFGFIPNKLEILSQDIGRDSLEEWKFIKNNFQMPHKYHYLTLIRSIMNKLEDKKTRHSFAIQGMKMMNPSFTKNVLLGIIDHTIRQTY